MYRYFDLDYLKKRLPTGLSSSIAHEFSKMVLNYMSLPIDMIITSRANNSFSQITSIVDMSSQVLN